MIANCSSCDLEVVRTPQGGKGKLLAIQSSPSRLSYRDSLPAGPEKNLQPAGAKLGRSRHG